MLALGLLLASWIPAAAEADPLAPARSGRLECYYPDHARKTCRSITVYRATAANAYIGRGTTLAEETGEVIMEAEAPVRIVRGAVCGVLSPDIIETARYMRNGTPLPDDEARVIMARLEAPTWTLFGKEFCTRHVTIGGSLVAIVAIDGAATSQIGQPLAWISPNDGYRVAR